MNGSNRSRGPASEEAGPRLIGEGALRSRAGRIGSWFSAQGPLSLVVLLLGTGSLVVSLGGSVVLALVGGLTPYESLLATIESAAQESLLWAGVALGVAAIGIGVAVYRRMPTKPAREATVSGAALGAQALLFSALYLWFRSGETERFVRNFLNFEFLDGLFPSFVRGAKNTVLLAISGEALGIALGLVLAMLVLSKRLVVRAPARAYINFFRGTPLLWQLSFISLVIILGFRLFPRDPYVIAILILGLNAGAYTAEVFRAGIQSIERGQMEAARSLGMSYAQAMRYVILPQTIRRVIPPLTNEFVILIKDTSLVLVLGLVSEQRELLKVGRDAYSQTYNATPYLGSALGYLVVTLPMIRVVSWLERRLKSGLTGIVG